MITINPLLAFAFYLGGFLILLFSMWFVHYKRKEKKARLPALFRLYVCEYCHFPYLAETHKPVTSCPQCKSFNK